MHIAYIHYFYSLVILIQQMASRSNNIQFLDNEQSSQAQVLQIDLNHQE